jgi:hypothetical protein
LFSEEIEHFRSAAASRTVNTSGSEIDAGFAGAVVFRLAAFLRDMAVAPVEN